VAAIENQNCPLRRHGFKQSVEVSIVEQAEIGRTGRRLSYKASASRVYQTVSGQEDQLEIIGTLPPECKESFRDGFHGRIPVRDADQLSLVRLRPAGTEILDNLIGVTRGISKPLELDRVIAIGADSDDDGTE